MRILLLMLSWVWASSLYAQPLPNSKYGQEDKFRQLDEWLPTPNLYRAPNGSPGPQYWQQRADYKIDVEIDDERQQLRGRETITYHNRSPHELTYVWLQLDQNLHRKDSTGEKSATESLSTRVPFNSLRSLLHAETFDGGFKITSVVDSTGEKVTHQIVDTMMRCDLREPLRTGEKVTLRIEFHFNIVDAKRLKSRGGFEHFDDDDNYIYEMAQWFPRMVAFTDTNGWQHKQFLGTGEFALTFGDYEVSITAPADHIVAATGTLVNPGEVLSEIQRERLEQARQSKKPLFVVTPTEAKNNERHKENVGRKTWRFAAENVRDFAFASSRKFIWDACGHEPAGGKDVMAMSFYPNEAEPLWSKYSTHAVLHTLEVYSRYTFPYPYPVAISVNGPIYGMEYPMICFNGPRPEKDGTYSKRTKYGLISVVIHEVGHNYFPMIVNSDERQWFWMDEGINTFLQYLAEQEWEANYPSQRGEPEDIVNYMSSRDQVPVMTAADSLLRVGENAYAKPATALNVLRETVLGRELFDFAFKEYSRRWMFKHPEPKDLFRTMEDASGRDLDWFWRGWFYSTDHVDIAIKEIRKLNVDDGDPDREASRKKKEKEEKKPSLSRELNQSLPKRADEFPELLDFYNHQDPFVVESSAREAYQKLVKDLSDEQRRLLHDQTNFYVLKFSNEGGVVMPIIFDAFFADGTSERHHYPAEIWRRNHREVNRLLVTIKTLERIELDPQRQTADANVSNNQFPPKIESSQFRLSGDEKTSNPMQKAKKKKESPAKKETPKESKDP
jgi:hypothetical protein